MSKMVNAFLTAQTTDCVFSLKHMKLTELALYQLPMLEFIDCLLLNYGSYEVYLHLLNARNNITIYWHFLVLGICDLYMYMFFIGALVVIQARWL